MKTGYILLLLLLSNSISSFSQSIENIRTTSDNQKVIIEYDLLLPDFNPVNVGLSVNINNSKTIIPKLLKGDLKAIKGGENKRIEWMALEEIGSIETVIKVSLIIYPVFNSVKIGTQFWMIENLSVDTFRNGDLILHAKNDEEWVNAGKEGKPAWCYYSNNPAIGLNVGKLYNWYAVNDPRGLAPLGWHIPSNSEWKKHKWLNDAVMGGSRHADGSFYSKDAFGNWWSSTESDFANALFFYAKHNEFLTGYRAAKSYGFLVRCIKSESDAP